MNGMGPIVRHYGISGYGGQGPVASANSPFPGLMMSVEQYEVRPRRSLDWIALSLSCESESASP